MLSLGGSLLRDAVTWYAKTAHGSVPGAAANKLGSFGPVLHSSANLQHIYMQVVSRQCRAGLQGLIEVIPGGLPQKDWYRNPFHHYPPPRSMWSAVRLLVTVMFGTFGKLGPFRKPRDTSG